MSISRIQTKTATGTIFVTDGIETLTLDSATQAGDLIVVIIGVSSFNRDVSSVVDNRSGGSHTYSVAVTRESASDFIETWTYYTVCTAACSTITVTMSSALGSDCWLAARVYRATNGWDLTPLGATNSNTNSAQASPAVSPTITTTSASALIVGVCQPDNSETFTGASEPGTAAAYTDIIAFSGSFAGGYAGDLIVSSTGTYSMSVTYPATTPSTNMTTIAEFQEAAPSGRTAKNTRAFPLGMNLGMAIGMADL